MKNFTGIPLSQQGKHAGKYIAIVDDCDADLANVRWRVQTNKRNRTQYALRSNRDFGISIDEFMHRVILEDMIGRKLNEGEYVDHINGNGLDNRRCNLRLATHQQNCANRRKQLTPKSSQYKGVTMEKDKKWKARIRHNNELIYLGRFSAEHDAHLAYVEASKRLFGEFANTGEG